MALCTSSVSKDPEIKYEFDENDVLKLKEILRVYYYITDNAEGKM